MNYFLSIARLLFLKQKTNKRNAALDFKLYCEATPWAQSCRIYDL